MFNVGERLLTCKNPPLSFLWSPGSKRLDRPTFGVGHTQFKTHLKFLKPFRF